MKNKLVTILIIVATVILAGVAIFTAIRLYQLRKEAVAPTAPEEPSAATPSPPAYEACTTLTFTISTPVPSECNSVCQTNSDCESDFCYQPVCPPGENCIDLVLPKVCRNESCPTDADCVCSKTTASPTPTGTSTPTPTGTSTSTPTPTGTSTPRVTSSPGLTTSPTPLGELPEAGTTLPTVIGIGAGIILLIISIALAL